MKHNPENTTEDGTSAKSESSVLLLDDTIIDLTTDESINRALEFHQGMQPEAEEVIDERQRTKDYLATLSIREADQAPESHANSPEVEKSANNLRDSVEAYWATQQDALSLSPRFASRAAHKTQAIYDRILRRGERPKRTSRETSRDGAPPLVAEVKDFWQSLGPKHRDPRLIPVLMRSALLIVRDGNEAQPRDAQQPSERERTELIDLLKTYSEEGSIEQNPDLRPKDLLTCGQMILDAGYCTKDIADKGRFYKLALKTFSAVEQHPEVADQDKAVAIALQMDIVFEGLRKGGLDLIHAHGETGKKAAKEKFVTLQGAYMEKLRPLLEKEDNGIKDGTANELATMFEIRHILLKNDAFLHMMCRFALEREDEAHDGLKRVGQSLNHDLVLEDPVNGRQMIQLKAKTEDRGEYADEIIFNDGENIIDPSMQSAQGRLKLLSQHMEVIKAMRGEERLLSGLVLNRDTDKVITPRKKEVIEDAVDKIANSRNASGERIKLNV